MTDKEIEQASQELTGLQVLTEILKVREPEKRERLLALAKKVGASRSRYKDVGGEDNATESQLVDNIHQALQTASMVNMCRTSAAMCEIASRNYKIALVAAVVAGLSAVAAWVAVLAR